MQGPPKKALQVCWSGLWGHGEAQNRRRIAKLGRNKTSLSTPKPSPSPHEKKRHANCYSALFDDSKLRIPLRISLNFHEEPERETAAGKNTGSAADCAVPPNVIETATSPCS